jgi:hypothetical protein
MAAWAYPALVRACSSERLIVAGAVIVVASGLSVKLLGDGLRLAAVTGPDLVTQFVEQIEHGERLLRVPDSGDFDGDWPQMRGHR